MVSLHKVLVVLLFLRVWNQLKIDPGVRNINISSITNTAGLEVQLTCGHLGPPIPSL